MDKIEINNSFEEKASDDLIRGATEKTLSVLRRMDLIEEGCDFELSVAVVDEKEIEKLNNQYRQKNQATDVLSFCYDNNGEKIVGELVLCLDVIEKNAKSDRMETVAELEKNVVHGILHIVGFEHGEKMFTLQDEIILDR
ncbi:MAG: rRNA maturation RNase YbeY [Patescibacteria group bacterium]|nr:rRNA maturation RNase YbeY [Patescibacteria group bacterium]